MTEHYKSAVYIFNTVNCRCIACINCPLQPKNYNSSEQNHLCWNLISNPEPSMAFLEQYIKDNYNDNHK